MPCRWRVELCVKYGSLGVSDLVSETPKELLARPTMGVCSLGKKERERDGIEYLNNVAPGSGPFPH